MSDRIISFGVNLDEFNIIQDKARIKNMSISMYCKSMIISETEFTKYYNILISKIKSYPLHCIFTIRDLIGDDIWNVIPKGMKLSIGRHFYSQVDAGIIGNINILGYGAARTMRYSKEK